MYLCVVQYYYTMASDIHASTLFRLLFLLNIKQFVQQSLCQTLFFSYIHTYIQQRAAYPFFLNENGSVLCYLLKFIIVADD